MPAYRKDKTPGVYVRHEKQCPATDAGGPKCKCAPSYRGKTRSHGWSRTFKTRAEAEGWKLDVKRGLVPVPTKGVEAVEVLTVRAIVEQWWQAVLNSEVGQRRKRTPYSPNTLYNYRAALDTHILPMVGDRLAVDMTLRDWQDVVDKLRRAGLKTNSINAYMNPVRAVYAYACSPRRELLPFNAVVGVEMPPVDETPRERVATPAEATRLLEALEPRDRVVWGIAFYTGCRSMEIGGDLRKKTTGVDWKYVDFEQGGLFVPDSKSEAGIRWVPMVKPLRAILQEEWMRQGRPTEGRVVVGTVGASKVRALGRPANSKNPAVVGAWVAAGLEPIGLHECRHTFVSYMAEAGIPAKLRSEIAGHEEESMTRRYTHTLPSAVAEARARLDEYLESSA